RASFILVGSFVLGLVAALVGVAVWLAGIEFDKAPAEYITYFEGDVTGLGIGSPVRYRGVPVGSVRDIRLDPTNVERVRVLMEVSIDAPIKKDTVAQLALQGITGVAFIQLTGGTQTAPQLGAGKGKIPIITSKQSLLQEVVGKLPQVVEKAALVADRIGDLLNKQNLNAITATLDNLKNFTNSLGSKQGELQLLLRDSRSAVTGLRDAVTDIRELTRKFGTRIGPFMDNSEKSMSSLRQTMTGIQKAATSIDQIAGSAQALLNENREPLRDFSQSGLYEFSQFIAEARILVDSLTRLTNRIERDPTHFLFGDSQKGVKAQ
ncbi:MCE family protein, partial [Alphaproteobacteria bacterium]|nr:MCE family protein [Alphaproteobacteria bacterium]